MSSFLRCLAVLALGLVTASRAGEAAPPGPSKADRAPLALRAVVEKLHPGMRIVNQSDIRAKECADSGTDHPGWLAADFNGDGLLDYGALLITDVPTKTVKFDGKDYPVYEALVVAFVAQAGSGFDEIVLYQFNEALPTTRGVIRQQQGEIYDTNGRRTVPLAHSAFKFFSCGLFSVVYFWDGKGFDEAKTSSN